MSLELALLIDLLAVATCGVLLLAHPAMRPLASWLHLLGISRRCSLV